MTFDETPRCQRGENQCEESGQCHVRRALVRREPIRLTSELSLYPPLWLPLRRP